VKRTLVILVKLAFSLAIISYLVMEIRNRDPQTFAHLVHGPKNWTRLAAAWAAFVAALVLGGARWLVLVRALQLQCSVAAALRLTLIAFVADFAALGAVGGDLLKAALLTQGQPGRGGDALASVLVDRLAGVFTLCLVIAAGVFVAARSLHDPAMWMVARAALLLATGMTAVVVVLWLPRPGAWLSATAAHLPWVGRVLAQMVDAIGRYRRHPQAVVTAAALSLAILAFNITGFQLTASGLPGVGPTLGEHLFIVPVSLLSGVVPLPMQTLGVLDYALEYFYTHASAAPVSAGLGLLVAMSYRLASAAIALVGVAVYLVLRRDTTHGIRGTHLARENVEQGS
jgi:glycosyltransferase 2 family protein